MPSLEEAVTAALRTVIDPEIGENIVDLGLVYRVSAGEQGIEIDLTMTSPACPMGEMILDDIERSLDGVVPDGVAVRLHLVWEPPWHPGMILPEAKVRLGWP